MGHWTQDSNIKTLYIHSFTFYMFNSLYICFDCAGVIQWPSPVRMDYGCLCSTDPASRLIVFSPPGLQSPVSKSWPLHLSDASRAGWHSSANTGATRSISAQSIQSVPASMPLNKNYRSDENSSCRRLSGVWRGFCDTQHFSDLWVPSGLVIFPHTPHSQLITRMNIVCSYLYIFVTRELVSH